ncbi:hypothetical protein GWN26_08800 [Candidatus Saccharibacteria bacterium]|nr:hypothetical protein [Candidatus Saccharibacteria bacterium]
MKTQNLTRAHVGINFGNLVIAFITGGLFIHVFIMLLDYYLMAWPLYLNLRENFMGGIFSAPMLPMMATYGLFSVATYFLWKKMKKAALLAREQEIQNEKVNSVLKSMQTMTGMLAEHIAIQNSQILNWIALQKAQGRTVSEKVQQPSEKIAATLQSLSEVAFVFPYAENPPKKVRDIESLLKGKLFQIERYRDMLKETVHPQKVIQR